MSEAPKALVIRTAGTNCDAEMVRAFQLAGATPDLVHLDRLIAEPARLEQYDLIGFPGGFSYGDDIASGRVLAARVRERLLPQLRAAIERGVPVIGVCNGFQALVQIGVLPGASGSGAAADVKQTAALADNASARFIDRWVRVEAPADSRCIWTRDLWQGEPEDEQDAMILPIAHGEGRFVAPPDVIKALEANGQVALRYAEDVNGSTAEIAGICDPTGRVFGLMPHPERYTSWTLHPFWTRLDSATRENPTPGLRVFVGAVEAVREGVAAA